MVLICTVKVKLLYMHTLTFSSLKIRHMGISFTRKRRK